MLNVNVISICGCGKPLIAVYDKEGKQIGVTHETFEDEDYHSLYFAGLLPIEVPPNSEIDN